MSIKMALVGNPNCGKTTMFNAMTGANQYVGNWPGVTVEKKEGKLKGHKEVVIQDLKEFGYTIATDLARYCPNCGRNTSQRMLLPIMRGGNCLLYTSRCV